MEQLLGPAGEQRMPPNMAAHEYQTYEIASPRATHHRSASCAEVDCPNRIHGWKTVLDVSKADHARVANWIRLQSGRFYTIEQPKNSTIVTFIFPSGQNCFIPHTVPLQRPELFLVKGGDWRGNPMKLPVVQHRPEDWVDDFANHQDKLATLIQRG